MVNPQVQNCLSSRWLLIDWSLFRLLLPFFLLCYICHSSFLLIYSKTMKLSFYSIQNNRRRMNIRNHVDDFWIRMFAVESSLVSDMLPLAIIFDAFKKNFPIVIIRFRMMNNSRNCRVFILQYKTPVYSNIHIWFFLYMYIERPAIHSVACK